MIVTYGEVRRLCPADLPRCSTVVRRGEEVLDVLFFAGADADAFVLAVEFNHAHGLPLSTADRKVAAARIVDSHPTWSDRWISEVTGSAARTAASVRKCSSERIRQSNVRVGKDGRVRPVDGTEARMRTAELMTANPSASLREVAKAAWISPSTAKDVRARLSRGESPVRTRQQKRDDVGPSMRATAAEFVASLARNPSLQFTESGRVLLRFIGCAAVSVQQWEEFCKECPCVSGKRWPSCPVMLLGVAWSR
jgi:hypothetical protein